MSKEGKKSAAKRLGVKSVLRYGGENLAITTFGRGNEANIAVKTDIFGSALNLPHSTDRFTISDFEESEIDIERGDLESLLENPAENPGQDYLGLKDVLEKEFFGQSFPNDNIRIQIIHNILDIQKILGLYINDVIYSVNNLQKTPEGKLAPEDVVGLSMSNDEKIIKNLQSMNPYLGYFGDAFESLPKPEYRRYMQGGVQKKQLANEDAINEAVDRNKNVLRALGAVRQISAHYKNSSVLFSKNEDLRKSMNKSFKVNWDVIRAALKERVDAINRNFLVHSKINLFILFDLLGIFGVQEKQAIVQEYYRFSILKEGKNLGLNMKKLRETMIESFYPFIKQKEYDSFRSKLYAICDYLLFRDLRNTEALDAMVAALRETADDSQKDALYCNFAQTEHARLNETLTTFFSQFKDGFPAFTTNVLPIGYLEGVALKPSQIPLVELLAFLCNFMDGKEINELLSAYIHKFENIQSLIDTLKDLKETVQFAGAYSMFNDCCGKRAGRIAQDLRVLVSIGKMKPDLDGAKRPLYKAAIKMLGIKDNLDYLTDEWLEQNVLLNDIDRRNREKTQEVNPFRNFIAGNVINSRRFFYLVRYAKPETVRALMENEAIVEYVLTRLPEPQIDTYYRNIGDSNDKCSTIWKINALVKKLKRFSFETLFSNRAGIVANANPGNRNKNVEIEKLKALTGLYLTVAYVAIKNLVKANARYYIAYSALERDLAMFEQKDGEALRKFYLEYGIRNGEPQFNRSVAITEYYLEQEEKNDYRPEEGQPFDIKAFRVHLKTVHRHFDKKWRAIFRQLIDEGKGIQKTGLIWTYFRNEAEHLNVLTALPQYVREYGKQEGKGGMTSYFDLYHFLLQRRFCDEVQADPECGICIPANYADNIKRFGKPCKDLIKIAYASLGYNLPRFKNLTIECLFDKDSVSGQERQKR